MQVIIVEDDGMVSDVISAALQSRGYGVTVFPEPSLEKICSYAPAPDILIFDLGTPCEMGAKICRDALQALPGCKLLAMTGNLEHGDTLDLPDGAVAPILQKPFSLGVLLDKVEELAGKTKNNGSESAGVAKSAQDIEHQMRSVAMVVFGSAALMADTAGGDAELKAIAGKIQGICDRGLDAETLALLSEQCATAPTKAQNNALFRQNLERMAHCCKRGLALLARRASLVPLKGKGSESQPETTALYLKPGKVA